MNHQNKRVEGFQYKLTDDRFGLDTVFGNAPAVNEQEMSITFPFADGNRRDGVGDLLEVGGIKTDRHIKAPLILFDHAKQVTLPVGMAEDPDTGQYTVTIDPITKVATAKAFIYQGKGLGSYAGNGEKDYDHAVFCEQLFDLVAKKFIRAGSIGYQVIAARELYPDYQTGTPKGMHLMSVLMLEASIVVLPANADTVIKMLGMKTICGKPKSPYLVKSLAPYAPARKARMGYEGRKAIDKTALDSALYQANDPNYLPERPPLPNDDINYSLRRSFRAGTSIDNQRESNELDNDDYHDTDNAMTDIVYEGRSVPSKNQRKWKQGPKLGEGKDIRQGQVMDGRMATQDEMQNTPKPSVKKLDRILDYQSNVMKNIDGLLNKYLGKARKKAPENQVRIEANDTPQGRQYGVSSTADPYLYFSLNQYEQALQAADAIRSQGRRGIVLPTPANINDQAKGKAIRPEVINEELNTDKNNRQSYGASQGWNRIDQRNDISDRDRFDTWVEFGNATDRRSDANFAGHTNNTNELLENYDSYNELNFDRDEDYYSSDDEIIRESNEIRRLAQKQGRDIEDNNKKALKNKTSIKKSKKRILPKLSNTTWRKAIDKRALDQALYQGNDTEGYLPEYADAPVYERAVDALVEQNRERLKNGEVIIDLEDQDLWDTDDALNAIYTKQPIPSNLQHRKVPQGPKLGDKELDVPDVSMSGGDTGGSGDMMGEVGEKGSRNRRLRRYVNNAGGNYDFAADEVAGNFRNPNHPAYAELDGDGMIVHTDFDNYNRNFLDLVDLMPESQRRQDLIRGQETARNIADQDGRPERVPYKEREKQRKKRKKKKALSSYQRLKQKHESTQDSIRKLQKKIEGLLQ